MINNTKIYALSTDGFNQSDTDFLNINIDTNNQDETLLVEINGLMYKSDDLIELLDLIKHLRK